MVQNLIVGVVVVLALLYAVWYLLPRAVRQRLAQIHPALGAGTACGACSSCAGCGAGTQPNLVPGHQSKGHMVRFYPTDR